MDIKILINELIKEYPEEATLLKPTFDELMNNLTELSKTISEKGSSYFKNHNMKKVEKSMNIINNIDFCKIELNNIINLYNLKENKSQNCFEIKDENIRDIYIEGETKKIKQTKVNNVSSENTNARINNSNSVLTLYDNFTHKKPKCFKIFGETYYIYDWKEMLIKTYEMLFELDKTTFEKFALFTQNSGKKRIVAEYDNGYREPRKVANKYIIETNLDSTAIRKLIINILKFFDINVNEFLVIAS